GARNSGRYGGQDAGQGPPEAAGLERAGGALGGPAEAIAQTFPPAHHGAPLADPAEAGRVSGHDHAGTHRLGDRELGEPEARHERMRVNDVGTLRGEPSVEALRTAHGHGALDFVAGRYGWNRVAIHGDTLVLV